MLGESLELNSLAGDPIFDVPRRHILLPSSPKIGQQLCEGHCETPTRSQSIPLIDVAHVDLKEEKLDEGLRIRQALKHRVHEACIT